MYEYDKANIFARIINKEIPAKIVFENEYALAFHDINPSAPVHVLVIPKGLFVCFDDFISNADDIHITQFFLAVSRVVKDLGLQENGYRLVANTGKDGGQTVPHFHMHILGKKQFNEQL